MGVTFGELEISQKFVSVPVTVTEAQIVMFGGIIGNWAPIHLNDEFAARAHFAGRRVAHGELTMALMVAAATPLIYTSLGQLGGTYKLRRPIFAGDTIYTEMEVLAKRPSKSRPGGIVNFGLKTYNQEGTFVAEGTVDFLVGNESYNLYSPKTPAGGSPSS